MAFRYRSLLAVSGPGPGTVPSSPAPGTATITETDGGQLLGCENSERSLRFGLERTYRTQAQLTSDRRRRTELVDLANSVRPSTWS